ncbi:MAG: GH3 auxin-responsive promoter family protein [Spirosomataceae bacterium]
MGLRSFFAKPFARYVVKKRQRWVQQPVETQLNWLAKLVSQAKITQFGKDHSFDTIHHHDDFKKAVPIRDYEDLRPYIDRMVAGEEDVLWRGKPLYLAKTSGTTSGVKYIPITKESVGYHFGSARDAVMSYIAETGRADFLDKKLIFLSGSPELDKKNGIFVGRLSGISNHLVPAVLRSNQLPSYETNCIEDWETKLDRIIDETIDQPMALISGIPPWVQMYFDRIIARTGKPIKDVFPTFSVFVYGGVNFEPYRAKLFDSIGKHVDAIETYPASEGFIAYQDSQQAQGMLLLLDNGIFYEFVPVEEFFQPNPRRLHIGEVEVGKNYALVLSTNAGLWGYSIGDTVKFVSLDPPRIVVTGRIKHFISAFGEHVIGEEVEKAMQHAVSLFPETQVIEFTVAPQVTPTEGGLPYHEWLVEFATPPHNLDAFAETLDQKMTQLNTYYDDLITGSILQRLKIQTLRRGAFIEYMKSQGKLGGQNKVPRLSNDRRIAEGLLV